MTGPRQHLHKNRTILAPSHSAISVEPFTYQLYQDEDTHVPIYVGNGSGELAWTVQVLEGTWVL